MAASPAGRTRAAVRPLRPHRRGLRCRAGPLRPRGDAWPSRSRPRPPGPRPRSLLSKTPPLRPCPAPAAAPPGAGGTRSAWGRLFTGLRGSSELSTPPGAGAPRPFCAAATGNEWPARSRPMPPPKSAQPGRERPLLGGGKPRSRR